MFKAGYAEEALQLVQLEEDEMQVRQVALQELHLKLTLAKNPVGQAVRHELFSENK
jgi:hypothetical protein